MVMLGRVCRSLVPAALTALALASCSAPDEANEPEAPVSEASGHGGRITVVYEESSQYEFLAQSLELSGLFEGIAETVHSTLVLPADLPTFIAECGEPNAYYHQGEVVMCYEFIDLFVESSLQFTDDPAKVQQQAFSTAAFFYLHEIGHALVDLLQIPITAREEDSVDTLATLILLGGGSEQALFSVIDNFGFMAGMVEGQGYLPFWDEHSLHSQRFYDIACMVYGSDPEAWAGMVGPHFLPEERAQRCPLEYLQKSVSWDALLAPHYVPDQG